MLHSNKLESSVLQAYTSQTGQTLASFMEEKTVLLVFLRHFGCTFCREAVADLAGNRHAIEAKGVSLAFVHLGTEEKAAWFFTPYKLTDVPRFSDPQGRLYQAFGLTRARLHQFLKLKNVTRIISAWRKGHFAAIPEGDIQRMPGVFLLQQGQIRKSFRHKLISDRPDYLSLAAAAL